ncbi:MAG TPA: CsbD family protein [Gemmatimonadaceae bacterium]
MNSDQMRGRWKEMKGRIREKWGQLTDDELDQVGGRWDQLVGLVQRRYGTAREDAEREVNDLRRHYESTESGRDRR